MCRISCLLLRVELPGGRRCWNDGMELSSIGKSDRAAPLALGAWARDARRNRLALHLLETHSKDLAAVSGIASTSDLVGSAETYLN